MVLGKAFREAGEVREERGLQGLKELIAAIELVDAAGVNPGEGNVVEVTHEHLLAFAKGLLALAEALVCGVHAGPSPFAGHVNQAAQAGEADPEVVVESGLEPGIDAAAGMVGIRPKEAGGLADEALFVEVPHGVGDDWIRADELKVLVDPGGAAVDRDGVGIAFEGLPHLSEGARQHDVVGVEPGEDLTFCFPEGALEGRGGSSISFRTPVETAVEALQQLNRSVGRTTIGDEVIAGSTLLAQYAIDSASEVFRHAVGRRDDGDCVIQATYYSMLR